MKPLLVARTSMLRFLRDRTALFFTLALPVMIILIIGSATSRFAEQALPVGIAEEGSGPLGAELRRSLDREPSISLVSFESEAAMGKAVRRGVVAAGIVIPAGYDRVLAAGEGAEIRFLVDQTRGFPAGARSAVAGVASRQGALVQAATFVTGRTGGGFEENLAQARTASELLEPTAVGVETATVGRSREGTLEPGINYQAPAVLTLMVFITSLAGAAALIESRRLGVTRRMLGTPTTARTILAGETLSRFSLAGFQALFIFAAGTLLFGVQWGQPAGAAAVILFFVAVGASVGMLFGTLFRTPEQAASVGPPIGIALGMLGGCMWPLEIVPAPMQAFGHLFPHAWAMDAWIELIGRGGGFGDILTELGVLAAYVAVLLPLAAWRLRRSIVGA